MKSSLTIFIIIFILFPTPMTTPVHADISLDGSMGPSGTLAGPNYAIGHDLGRMQGTNLFHSFSRFNVTAGESATFTGPNAIENVIGRVTGGASSTIDGLLRSTIQDANLFLINPSGVMFGLNATLDVNGSFHVSTADYLKLSDGGVFFADPTRNSVLTVAPPSAFGFLGDNPAAITIDGSSLKVPEGETLSVIGGDIRISGGFLEAPEGRINIAGVASQGRVIPNASIQIPDLDVDTFERLGEINVSQDSRVDVTGEGAGAVMIRGGTFRLDNSKVVAGTKGNKDGSGIDIRLAQDCVVSNEARISAYTSGGTGDAGDIAVDVGGSLTVKDNAVIDSISYGAGQAGDLTVTASESVSISGVRDNEGNAGGLFIAATGSGSAGILSISTPVLNVDDATLSAATSGEGDAGSIMLEVQRLSLKNGALASVASSGAGRGGFLEVNATESVVIEGRDSQGFATFLSSAAEAGGNAGSISVTTPTMIVDDAVIDASSLSSNTGEVFLDVGSLSLTKSAVIRNRLEGYDPEGGGVLDITAAERISIDQSDLFGAQGGISVTAPVLNVNNGRIKTILGGEIYIDVKTVALAGDAQIETEDGGDITFKAGDITITGSTLYTWKGYASNSEVSGDILIEAKTLELTGEARIKTEAGGNITFKAGDVAIAGDSMVYTYDGFGEDNPLVGNIRMDVEKMILSEGSTIRSSSSGDNGPGNITINASEELGIFSRPETDVLRSSIHSSYSGNSEGSNISISTPRMIIDNGSIYNTAWESGRSGDILINATDEIIISSTPGIIFGTSYISTSNYGDGETGMVSITTPSLTVNNASIGSSPSEEKRGKAGDTFIDVGVLSLTDSATFRSSTYSAGKGGNITINASESISIFSSSSLIPSGIRSVTSGSGDAGKISISTPRLTMDGGSITTSSVLEESGSAGEVVVDVGALTLNGGARISSDTGGTSQGGTVTVTATDSVLISGRNSYGDSSAVSSSSFGAGDAGSVSISAPILAMDGGGVIHASTTADGNAGSISIEVENLTLAGGSQIQTVSTGSGDGGNLQVTASGTIALSGMSSDGKYASSFLGGAYGSGQGGDIDVEARQINITDGAGIWAQSEGPGDAGTIDIAFKNVLFLKDGYVGTTAEQADGGNIRIHPGRTLYLADGEITATVGGGPKTTGGNISIETDYVALNGGNVVANAYEGKGGNIRIAAGTYLSDPNSVVSASSALGIDGTVDIDAPDVNTTGVQVPLPKAVFGAGDLLRNPCIARLKTGDASSFIISGRDGLPIQPGQLQPSPVFQEIIAEKEEQGAL